MSGVKLAIILINLNFLALGVEYCIDWKCSTECCIDIYNCSPYPKCEFPRSKIGEKCILNDDCESKCCNNKD